MNLFLFQFQIVQHSWQDVHNVVKYHHFFPLWDLQLWPLLDHLASYSNIIKGSIFTLKIFFINISEKADQTNQMYTPWVYKLRSESMWSRIWLFKQLYFHKSCNLTYKLSAYDFAINLGWIKKGKATLFLFSHSKIFD